jgi:hypothetical protein
VTKTWFQAFAFKWVNLCRYAAGLRAMRAQNLIHRGGAVHVERC